METRGQFHTLANLPPRNVQDPQYQLNRRVGGREPMLKFLVQYIYIYIYKYIYICVCLCVCVYIYTYLLTPWCRVLLEKLTGLQLVKKFPAFHGTRRFITTLKSVRHMSLFWASPIQSIYPHPTSWRSILIYI